MGKRIRSMRNWVRKAISIVLFAALATMGTPAFALDTAVQQYTITAKSAGSFALVAVAGNRYVIEPEMVSYTNGQTIRQALNATSHEFSTNNEGWIYAIDGEDFGISIFYDGGDWDLDVPASTVQTAIVLTSNGYEETYSEDALLLARKLAEQSSMDAEKAAYQAVAEAYQEAREVFPTADPVTASELLQGILDAEAAYSAWLASPARPIVFNITKGGIAVTSGLTVEVVNEGGIVYKDTSGNGHGLSLRKGSYTYKARQGNYEVSGSFNVSAGSGTYTVSAALPAESFYSSISFLVTSGSKPSLDFTQNGESYTVNMPDDIISLGFTLVPAKTSYTINTHTIFGEYADTDGTYRGDETLSSNRKAWNSTTVNLAKVVPCGLEGRTGGLDAESGSGKVALKIVHKEGATVQRQYIPITIKRIPQLANIVVKESSSGTHLPLTFDKDTKSYEVQTVASKLAVSASTKRTASSSTYGAYAEGYGITVNGTNQAENGSVTFNVSDGGSYKVVAKANAAHGGLSTTYTLKVKKVAAVRVRLNKPSASISTQLLSEVGDYIEPTTKTSTYDEFNVAPGNYSWVATLDTHYHASSPITIEQSGANTFTVSVPVKRQLLMGLLARGNNINNNLAIDGDKVFAWNDYSYTFVVRDTDNTFRVYPTFGSAPSGAQNFKFTRLPFTNTSGTQQPAASLAYSTNASYLSSTNFVAAGKLNNSMVCRVSYDVGTVTYYQDYTLSTKRLATLRSLSVKGSDGRSYEIECSNSTNPGTTQKTFADTITEYTTRVPSSLESLDLSSSFGGYSLERFAGYTVKLVNADGEEIVANNESAASFTKTVPLVKGAEAEDILLIARTGEDSNLGNENVPQTYTLHVEKSVPVTVKFATTPASASIFVSENATGDPVQPESDGSYKLMRGATYSYSSTAPGYVSEQVTGYVASEDETIRIQLRLADMSSFNTNLNSTWPRFRFDENNNGVIPYATPIEASKTTLYWAAQLGSGYGSGATGCPILVDDYLYTYAANRIIKADAFTGQVVASAEMVANSSFAINSPVYADGMVFVGLANGRIQAFNAETLESVWVYSDPLGGQPNCPISCYDGYVYSGFWNGETKSTSFACLSVSDEDPSSPTESKPATWRVKDKGFYWAGAYVGPGSTGGTTAGRPYVIVGTDDGDSGFAGRGDLLSLDARTGKVIDRFAGVASGDIRSSISFDGSRFYFASKGGDFCNVQVRADGTFNHSTLRSINLGNECTSTPCVYNNRAYVGVGAGFAEYRNQYIAVIDLKTFRIAYKVPTAGYPQTSGLVTTAYDEGDGTVYVYFVDNMTPGTLRCIKDKPGQTAPVATIVENDRSGKPHSGVASALWTPSGSQSQYAICSPIANSDGFMFFKNDSAYMMMVGPTIDSLEVVSSPNKTEYLAGEEFDPMGVKVVAHFSNGAERDVSDYLAFSLGFADTAGRELEVDDTEVTVSFKLGTSAGSYSYDMYQNEYTSATSAYTRGVAYHAPTTTIPITVTDTHTHTMAQVAKKAATCEEDGNIAHWKCSTCARMFSDKAATKELTAEQVAIAKLGHSYGAWTQLDDKQHQRVCTHDKTHVEKQNHAWDSGKVTKQPTTGADGVMTFTCTVCKATHTETIPHTGFAVAFVDGLGKTLKTQYVEKGKAATAPSNPTREGYDFTGWDKGFSNVADDITVTALWSLKRFIVSWKDGDGNTIDTRTVGWGRSPVFIGLTDPTKTATAQYTYVWDGGWKDAAGKVYAKGTTLPKVTAPTTFTATFMSTGRSYTVGFVAEDGKTVLKKAQKYAYGTKLEDMNPPTAPAKASNVQYTYKFDKWINAKDGSTLTTVKTDATYKASYKATKRSYKVTFVDGQGKTLATPSVEYGKAPALPVNPTRTGYTFTGWKSNAGTYASGKALPKVTGAITYTAQWKINQYKITWADDAGKAITTDMVNYNTLPKYTGITPAKKATTQYTYTFNGWTPTVVKATKAATYKAVFKASANITAVTLSPASATYTGSAVAKPKITVKAGNTTVPASGYTATWSTTDFTKVGTKTLTVKGKGAYAGTETATFKITAASVAKASVTVANQTHTGKALAPAPTVKLNGKTLKVGTDYTVSYKNNVKAGTATVTVTGKGNYTGSTSKTFRIVGWTRLWGQGSLDTMAEISKAWGSAKTAVVATNADFKDTLAAIGLAGSLNCPVLVTSPKGLSAQTRGELQRMGVKTVYVMGGTGGVTAAVEDAIKALPSKPAVKRIAGKDASSKSVAAAKAMPSRSKTVVITRPLSFGDALSVSPYAYATKSPVIYTDPATGGGTPQYKLSAEAVNYIKSAGFTHAVVVGGIYAVPESVLDQLASAGIKAANVTRLAGNGAYETSRVIGEWATGKLKNGTGGNGKGSGFYKWSAIRFQPAVKLSANDVGVSRGDDWKDALCGSALCGKKKSILLLASKENQANAVVVGANKASVTHGYIFGGSVAVPEKVVKPFRDAAL